MDKDGRCIITGVLVRQCTSSGDCPNTCSQADGSGQDNATTSTSCAQRMMCSSNDAAAVSTVPLFVYACTRPDHGVFVLFNCYLPACSGNNAPEQIVVS